ncbi:MAG: hypothetical protein II497_08020 [Lachnospiraceae bacterium]|nr:hypothetical protein [Lachnospiraceae bacterium]
MARKLTVITVAVALMCQTAATATAYADENVEEAPAPEEGAEGGELAEGELPPAEEGVAEGEAVATDTVTPGSIMANNGMYIANTFPDSYLPSGFRKQTVAYQGQNVDLAYMDASGGAVTLAYLTDASGSFGDFYLCDTATATMSDYVRFEGGNDRFLIVLNPSGVSVPDGFVPASLTVNGKSVQAWVYSEDGDSSSKDDKDDDKNKDEDKDEDKDKDKDKKGGLLGLFGSLAPVKAYAGELDLGVGAGAETGAPEGAAPATVDPAAADPATADPAAATGGDTEVADLTSSSQAAGGEASPGDFFLIYGMDQSGSQGFYLFDSVGQTYQRYVALGAGESDELAAAKKTARTRLFIICGLAVLALVLLILVINMALSGRRGDDDYYDYDDDYEEMKRRVEKKSKRSSGGLRRNKDYDDDYYDDYDDEEEEDVKVYDKAPKRSQRRAAEPEDDYFGAEPDPGLQPRRKAPAQDIDLDDDFSFDFIKK